MLLYYRKIQRKSRLALIYQNLRINNRSTLNFLNLLLIFLKDVSGKLQKI